MTAIITKILSAIMSIVVFLSGAFPGLFGGKQYINPYGDEVHIGTFYYYPTAKIFENYESLCDAGGNGCIVYGLPEKYDTEYFKNNSLVIFTVEVPHDDFRIWVKSVVENGDTLEVKYSVITDYSIRAQLYTRYTSEVIIETGKGIKNVELVRDDIIVPFDIEYIDQDPFAYFDEFYYG